jgi:shikimate kinase
MFIYLIGPSGVGKTALCKAVCDGSQLIHVNLEALVSMKNGRAKIPDLVRSHDAGWYWDQCNKIIEEISGKYKFHKSKIIIDMGSAVLASSYARDFLAGKNTMAITQSPGEVFIKLKQNRSLQKVTYHDWDSVEYSPERRKAYDSCKVKIDISDLPEAEAIEKFRAALGEPGPAPEAAQIKPGSQAPQKPATPQAAPKPAPGPIKPAAPAEPPAPTQPGGEGEPEYIFVRKTEPETIVPSKTETGQPEPEPPATAVENAAPAADGALSSEEEAALQRAKEAMEEIYRTKSAPAAPPAPERAAEPAMTARPTKPKNKPAPPKEEAEPAPMAFWLAVAGCAMSVVATIIYLSIHSYVIPAVPAGLGVVLAIAAFIFNKWRGPIKVKIGAAAAVVLSGLALVFPVEVFIGSIIVTGVFGLIELKAFLGARSAGISTATFVAVLAGYAISVVLASMLFGESFLTIPEDEARNNLAGYQKAQEQYIHAHARYAANFTELNWWPESPEHFTYYISPLVFFRNRSDRHKLPDGIAPFAAKNDYLFVAVGFKGRGPEADVWSIKPGSKPEHLHQE